MFDTPAFDPAEHAKDFSARWVDRLENAVEGRMHALGLADDQIGTSDHKNRVAWRTFFPDEGDGGNVTAVGRINVDSGVLNPDLLIEAYGEQAAKVWAKARLRDRIDSIIVHEEVEYRENGHEAALRAAPSPNDRSVKERGGFSGR
jgi:hypothetical protein